MKQFISTVQLSDGKPDLYWCDGLEETEPVRRERCADELGQLIRAGEATRGAWTRLMGDKEKSLYGFRCLRSDRGLFVDVPVAKPDPKGRIVLVSIGGPVPASMTEWEKEYRRVCDMMEWSVDDKGVTLLRGALDPVPIKKKFLIASVFLVAASAIIWWILRTVD